MNKITAAAADKLFLLEFIVDKVSITNLPEGVKSENEYSVSFQFFDHEPVEICEGDLNPTSATGTKVGKSCLFPLPTFLIDQANNFNILVRVYKKPKFGPKKAVGNCDITITELLVQIIKSLRNTTVEFPVSKALKDTFFLVDKAGETTGSITLYVRLSCFGKVMVTQFQLGATSSIFSTGDNVRNVYNSKISEQESTQMYKHFNRDIVSAISTPALPCKLGFHSTPHITTTTVIPSAPRYPPNLEHCLMKACPKYKCLKMPSTASDEMGKLNRCKPMCQSTQSFYSSPKNVYYSPNPTTPKQCGYHSSKVEKIMERFNHSSALRPTMTPAVPIEVAMGSPKMPLELSITRQTQYEKKDCSAVLLKKRKKISKEKKEAKVGKKKLK